MKGSLIILTLCAFAAAMIPMERRAMDPEETVAPTSSTSTTSKPKEICAPRTPCGWTFYKNDMKIVEKTVINTYCDCANGTVCQKNEEAEAINGNIHRCRPPLAGDETDEDISDS